MIEIKKSPNADTRTADKNTSLQEFSMANDSHINDVSRVMFLLGEMLIERGKLHDHTKKEYEGLQYKAFKETLANNADFSKSEWYQMHIATERHHLFKSCPEDVNLIDVMEMITDIIVSGLARSEKRVTEIAIENDLLQKALKNTISLINDNIKLID